MPEEYNINPSSLSALGNDPFGLSGFTYNTSWRDRKNARNATAAESAFNARVNYAYWIANNLYNSPAEQMKRYQEAGLNPNMIYEKDNNVVAGTAPSSSAKVGGKSDVEQIQGLFSGLVGAISAYNGLRLQNAQISKAESDADLADQRARGVALNNFDLYNMVSAMDILNRLPNNWEKMSLAELKASGFDFDDSVVNMHLIPFKHSNGVSFGTSNNQLNSAGVGRFLYPLLKKVYEGATADKLYNALYRLRDAQVGNINSQTDLNVSKEELTDIERDVKEYYHKYMQPNEATLLRESAAYIDTEKSLGVVGKVLDYIAKTVGTALGGTRFSKK